MDNSMLERAKEAVAQCVSNVVRPRRAVHAFKPLPLDRKLEEDTILCGFRRTVDTEEKSKRAPQRTSIETTRPRARASPNATSRIAGGTGPGKSRVQEKAPTNRPARDTP